MSLLILKGESTKMKHEPFQIAEIGLASVSSPHSSYQFLS